MRHEDVVDTSKPMTEMPKYLFRKEVHAMLIESVDSENGILYFGMPFTKIQIGKSWIANHSPEAGGYYVMCADGYVSYCPAKAFEEGYVPAKPSEQAPLRTSGDLENRFYYHAPKGNQAARYEEIREACLVLAEKIVQLSPTSREQTRSLNSLDEVMFLANAAIARNE